MELLEHRQSSDVGSSILENNFETGASMHPHAGDISSCRSQGSAGGICQDKTAERAHGEGMEDGETGPVQVFQLGETTTEPDSSVVVTEALRCQVKITTRRSLHLRIANHTTQDVYVRLVGHGERIAGISTGCGRYTLKQGAVAVKDSVPLSPLEPPAEPAAAEHRSVKGETSAFSNDLQPPCVSTETSNPRPQALKDEDVFEEEDEAGGALTISETAYSPCASMLPSPVVDSQGGVDLLFSPIQSPARLLRELHADPDIQAQLEAERARDRTYEHTRRAARSQMSGVLTSSLRLLSSNERVNACVLSVVRFISVVAGILLVTVPTLLLLLESDIDWSFLHEIRQTPEFEQFHYEYYCPLRRWILCRISMAMENLGSD